MRLIARMMVRFWERKATFHLRESGLQAHCATEALRRADRWKMRAIARGG